MNKEDYFKYYIQGSDHYLIPKDVFKELFNEMSNWREEAKGLKKQLDKAHDELYTLKNKYNIRLLNQISENIEPDCEDYYLAEIETKAHKYDLIQNQQKEFIEYLEYKLCIANKVLDKPEEDEVLGGYVLARKFMVEEILSKYKSIIGGKE